MDDLAALSQRAPSRAQSALHHSSLGPVLHPPHLLSPGNLIEVAEDVLLQSPPSSTAPELGLAMPRKPLSVSQLKACTEPARAVSGKSSPRHRKLSPESVLPMLVAPGQESPCIASPSPA